MDGGLGISLRKKKTVARPKISAPKQIVPAPDNASSSSLSSAAPALRAPNWDGSSNSASANAAPSRPRPSISGQDRTADLVKRRYSTRFAQYPQDGDAPPPVPGVPQLPAHFAAAAAAASRPSREGRSPERAEGQRIRVDAKALRDAHLQPEQYVAHLLANASESEIHAYQADLRKLQNRTSTDLQHNVYQNRTQFIKISKEADKLKTEMRTLRILMSELTGVLGHAASAGGADPSYDSSPALSDRKRANRSSVANLEALWTSQLQTLWKRVEGSQKYLPAVPGRHVLHESGRWLELNAATWKPRRRVHLILLNDHMLFASEKKRVDQAGVNGPASYQPPVQTHLVAERCWPLQDVQIADISAGANDSYARQDKSSISHAVNVRVGTESWTFATASTADGNAETSSLLVAFRKAAEDLRKTMAAEHGERERALDELAFLTGDSRLLKKANTTEGIDSAIPNRSSTLIDVDGRQQSLGWVESQIDALDIDVALQHFEDAVARTEKLRRLARNIKGNAVAQEIILLKVDERATRLAAVLGRSLRETNTGATATKENVGWLVRLGFEEMARIAYLDARKEVMRKRTRQLPFTGSLPPHLTALSYVTFTLILHTFRTFSSSFPPASSSAVVKWAKERIDEFNESLDRQLSSVEPGSALQIECIDIVKQQSQVLSEVGVDFSDLVARGLLGSDNNSISNNDHQHPSPPELALPRRGAPVGLGLS
ncbi:hypothetical protein MBLNU459_g5673t3 [Dothideomycetes sp. NU459]